MNQNCYNCKHRQDVPGSAHSSCNIVPKKQQLLLAMYVIKHVSVGIQPDSIKFNEHGVINGWCMWPIDFDPCWVSDCKFWESKE